MPAINETAPDFTLRTTNKEDFSLSSLRGQNVVIAFFPAAFTGVCQQEMCSFNDSLSALNNANAVVIGISADGPFALGAFGAQNNLNFTLLSDHKREAISAYGVALPNFAGAQGYTVAQRSVFIVDAEGILRYEWIAPNPGVEPNYDEVISQVSNL